jgi:hypothetical protein
MRFLLALAATWCWAATAVPAQAQLGIEIGVGGGVSAGVDIGSGAPSVSVSIGGADGTSAGSQSGASGAPQVLTQQAALDAVRTNRAVPLETVMAQAALMTDGQVVDAHLVMIGSFLLYELKVLESTGDVIDLYFYARSGQVVQAD